MLCMHKIYNKCTYLRQSCMRTEPEARIKFQSFIWEMQMQGMEGKDKIK